jgi:hypothetical protein
MGVRIIADIQPRKIALAAPDKKFSRNPALVCCPREGANLAAPNRLAGRDCEAQSWAMSDEPGGPYVTATGALSWVGLPVPQITEKDKVERWFIEPLLRMKEHDGFICLMVCFPLLEVIIRHEHEIPDHLDVTLSHGSAALHWFAKFMTIPDAVSRELWDAARNGLLHRAMIKGTLAYEITGRDKAGRPAEYDAISGRTAIYVWDFRDKVVAELKARHRNLWKGKRGSELAGIYLRT